MLDYMIATPKRHILGRNRVFWHILRQNWSRGLGCSELQEPPKTEKRKKTNTFWCAKSRMHGNETPVQIVTNFCRGVGVHDVITSANFYDCRLWGLSVVGVKFWVSPLTCVVALTTLLHYRASVWYRHVTGGQMDGQTDGQTLATA